MICFIGNWDPLGLRRKERPHLFCFNFKKGRRFQCFERNYKIDIRRTINKSLFQFGYPRELWYKLYKRKGHAHIKMKQYLLAREALETSLKNVGRSDIKKEKDRDNYRMRVRILV